jgi:lipoprotein-anchoring transpeptidase ErfK/SrfK
MTRRNLAWAGGIVAAVALLVASLLALDHDEPELRPAASRPTTTTTTTAPPRDSPTTAAPTTAAGPADLAALPARTSQVATVRSTAGEITAYAAADGSEVAATVPRRGDYGQAQVFLVLATDGSRLQVLLPVRPNGSKGWIDADEVAVASHDYQIQVSLSGFQLMVQKGTEVLVDTPVGVGADDTPTVGGQYYTWVLIDPTNAGYGSYAYGLSGFSTLESFGGGDGRLGIHGDTDPSSFGRRVSHGCVRVPDDVMVRLVEEVGLPLGVPVTVLA